MVEPGSPEALLDVRGVGRVFPGARPVPALREVSLTVPAGDFVAVMGPSGSGKSTLLCILGLLDRPTTGSYRIGAVETAGLSDRQRTALRARRLGFVFQAFHLMPGRTAAENVALGEMYAGVGRRGRQPRAHAALARVGMSHRADFPPAQLSGGEQQRVAIARALVGGPDVLLCDEPTGNLDSGTSATVLELFAALNADGMTVVLITHDAQVAARANRTVHLHDGRLLAPVPA
jgi:putative ABC transport system ATP-binding protein